MVAKSAEDIAAAEAAYVSAQAVHQGTTDSYYVASTPGLPAVQASIRGLLREGLGVDF